jgi:hypothetical protein
VGVAFATCSLLPEGWPDDRETAALLGADFVSWDDPEADWDDFERVIVRSVFNYTHRVDEFLVWCEAIGPARLRNTPDLIAFNADKRYLAELEAPTVPTVFVTRGDSLPAWDGEFVVKPNVSSGARDTGRFSERTRAEATALVDRIAAGGRVALVQPYLTSVDERGEAAFVFIGGELSHVLRKRALLRPDEVAPVATVELGRKLGVAQAMFRPDLVVAGEADAEEHRVAETVLAEVTGRFGRPLLLRVDIVRHRDGNPAVLELEAIDPLLYLGERPTAAAAFAAAVRAS